MISLDKKKMNVVHTAKNGVVNEKTIFLFNQLKDRVYARYSGGEVQRGMLVGRIEGADFRFSYVQIHEDGQIAGGKSICEIEESSDGKITLTENFVWEQGKGKNVFAELS